MDEALPMPPDASPAVLSSPLALELRGAVQLVLAGIAVRVLICSLPGNDLVAALDEVADLAAIVPVRTEHDPTGTYTVIVGLLRA
jgi:hypothetical protein